MVTVKVILVKGVLKFVLLFKFHDILCWFNILKSLPCDYRAGSMCLYCLLAFKVLAGLLRYKEPDNRLQI